MTNWDMCQLYFKNHESGYIYFEEDTIDIRDPSSEIQNRYRISANIICYDHERKYFKQFLPELYWNMVYIPQPPVSSLKYYLIIRKEEFYKIYKRDRIRRVLHNNDYINILDKMGHHFKPLFRLAIWFHHFVRFKTFTTDYKKFYAKIIMSTLEPRYYEILTECTDQLYEKYYNCIEKEI